MILIGVDTGGTFTDIVCLDVREREIRTAKSPSNSSDIARGVLAALEGVEFARGDVQRFVHSTTVGTNALLERKGSATGLICTRGFRDVLDLRRRDRPTLFGLRGEYRPLVERDLRVEVDERVDARGNVVVVPSADEIRRAGESLQRKGVEIVVVSLLHSYANSANECRVHNVLAESWPEPSLVLSSDVLAEWREFERTSTAVVNAYVKPLMSRYLGSLKSALPDYGVSSGMDVFQSNGGLVSAEIAAQRPVTTVLSGPAAGVSAAAFLASAGSYPNLITFDMGGTSCDVSVVIGGKAVLREQIDLEFGIPIRVPMVDVLTIGAGGGSIARVDNGGFLDVGPESAGARPGPAAYALGGTDATVTDANVVLGRIDPLHAIGGITIDRDAATKAVSDAVGKPLGLNPIAAAEAIIDVVCAKMSGALKRVTIERGHDPAEFDLLAFGGAGPLHAVRLGKQLGVRRILVPRASGVLSALGCVLADIRHDFVQTVNVDTATTSKKDIWMSLDRQRDAGLDLLRRQGIDDSSATVWHAADLIFEGQTHTFLLDPIQREWTMAQLRSYFRERYKEHLNHVPNGAVVRIVNLKTHVVARRDLGREALLSLTPINSGWDSLSSSHALGNRELTFDGQLVSTTFLRGRDLPPGSRLRGPAVILEADSTIILEPASCADVDAFGNLVVSYER